MMQNQSGLRVLDVFESLELRDLMSRRDLAKQIQEAAEAGLRAKYSAITGLAGVTPQVRFDPRGLAVCQWADPRAARAQKPPKKEAEAAASGKPGGDGEGGEEATDSKSPAADPPADPPEAGGGEQ